VSPNTSHTEPFAVGLDLGGTDLKSARVLADGRIEGFGKRPSRSADNAEGPLEAIAEAVEELTGGRRDGLVGVGLGSPGVIHPDTGALVGSTPHFQHWDAFPFRERLAARLGTPLAVDNDANLAALAEHRLGAARGARVSITLTIGTGIGAGIIVDGRVFHGAWGGAGEIGHLPLGRGGATCRCGVTGCVEPEASGSGLGALARAWGMAPPEARTVFAAAAAGEPRACAAIETMADRLGAAIGAAVSLINPEVVVVGGGVAQAGDALMSPLRVAVLRYTMTTHREGLRLVAAALGERAGVAGAGLLAWDAHEAGRRSSGTVMR
jgi:glucokinase